MQPPVKNSIKICAATHDCCTKVQLFPKPLVYQGVSIFLWAIFRFDFRRSTGILLYFINKQIESVKCKLKGYLLQKY